MEWLWHALVIAVVVIPVTILWIGVLVELFTRPDLKWWQRLGWIVIVVVLPVIGSLIYILYTWLTAGGREPSFASALPSRRAGRSANAPDSVADLAVLDRLRRQGVLTEAEFEAGKRRLLEGITAAEEATAAQSINTERMPKHGASS